MDLYLILLAASLNDNTIILYRVKLLIYYLGKRPSLMGIGFGSGILLDPVIFAEDRTNNNAVCKLNRIDLFNWNWFKINMEGLRRTETF